MINWLCLVAPPLVSLGKYRLTMKKFISSTTDKVSTSVQKATSKPTSKDEEFEELRERFNLYKKAVEAIKNDARKLQEETRSKAEINQIWPFCPDEFSSSPKYSLCKVLREPRQ